jgi:PDZ domain
MDETNYVSVELPKPMGIVFEENDSDFGGVFVQSLKEDGVAQKNGVLQEGDQLVAVNIEKVSGLSFDDALEKIVEAQGPTTKLILFRGKAKQLYGPTGASQAWLEAFIAKGGVPASVGTSIETGAAGA